MANWKKIIVSGSIAELQAISASARTPFVIGTTNNVQGETSNVPLVWDGTSGRIGTGSAYAVQGGTDYVSLSGSLGDNIILIGAGTNSIKTGSGVAPVDMNQANMSNTGNIIFISNRSLTGEQLRFSNGFFALKQSGVSTNDRGQLELKYHDFEFVTNEPTQENSASISSSISTHFFFGDSVRKTPILKFHAADAESALTDRFIFEDSVSNRNYAIQVKPNSNATKAEWALINGASTKVIHVSGSGVGIGGTAGTSGLNVTGPISGSNGINIDGLENEPPSFDDYPRTLVYNQTTGDIRARINTDLGGVTNITAGTNINTNGTTGNVTINVNTSLSDLTGIEVDGRISGSNLVISGSGATVVAANQITASNLLVEDAAVFNGTFLFSGLDFTVQNASTFSGSNQFGSGSLPSNVFHEFTGSVDITGSLAVDGGFTIDDLTVTGNTILGNNAAEDTVQINADVTLFGGSTLDVRDSVILGQDANDTLTVNAVSTFNENVTISSANLNVDGAVTASLMQLPSLTTANNIKQSNLVVVSGSNHKVYTASLSDISLGDITSVAGGGILINDSTVSFNSASLSNFFASESLKVISGDVTHDDNGDNTFTSNIAANAVTPAKISFIDDSAATSIGDGEILIGNSAGTNFAKQTITGVITLDKDGNTAFTSDAGIGTANEASQSYINSASIGDHSIVLTNTTNGNVTQSLKVDGTNADFKYNTGTNVLTVGGSTFGNNVSIAGNLTVAGTTTTINTETVTIEDNFIELNSNLTSTDVTEPEGVALQDAGLSINRGNQATASFYWDESANRWAISLDDPTTDTTPELTPNAYMMYVYTATSATPPAHVGADDDPGWDGYGSTTAATKIGATYISNTGDIYIYA